jgi:hypothetical protein
MSTYRHFTNSPASIVAVIKDYDSNQFPEFKYWCPRMLEIFVPGQIILLTRLHDGDYYSSNGYYLALDCFNIIGEL